MSERDIFIAALEKPPQERAAYLDAVCTGNPELRLRIDVLQYRRRDARDARSASAFATSLRRTIVFHVGGKGFGRDRHVGPCLG